VARLAVAAGTGVDFAAVEDSEAEAAGIGVDFAVEAAGDPREVAADSVGADPRGVAEGRCEIAMEAEDGTVEIVQDPINK